ncbi:MAG: hypothetical protein JXR30_02365 [Alphaproteobacteria bacterium]|nr:hypothetical protein [Alphaproteobacteria bacterium]
MSTLSFAFWQNEMARMGLPEMPLKDAQKTSENPVFCEPSTYHTLVHAFLKKVGFDHKDMQDLWRISLTREGIIQIREGKLPENLDVIFKVPLDYGGEANMENMLLIQTHPFVDILFKFMREQCKRYHQSEGEKSALYGYKKPPKLFVPDLNRRVFVPAMLGWTSPAGNGATDRMTQAGISIASEGRDV